MISRGGRVVSVCNLTSSERVAFSPHLLQHLFSLEVFSQCESITFIIRIQNKAKILINLLLVFSHTSRQLPCPFFQKKKKRHFTWSEP